MQIRKGEKIIQQEKQTNKIEQENDELEPETKEIKREILRKIHQIKHMKIEEREKLWSSQIKKRGENPNK